MTKDEILGRIAQLQDLSGRLWNIAHEYDCFDEPEMSKLLTETNRESDQLHFDYARLFDDAYVMQFRGCLTDAAPLELSHYDIEDELRKVYGDKVSCDSESGGFFVDTTRGVAGQVQQFLSTKYPHLDFGVYDAMETEKQDIALSPGLPNRIYSGNARKYLDEHNIEPLPLEYEVKPRPDSEIKEMMAEVVEILKKTGLPPIDAYIVLATHMDLAIDVKITDGRKKKRKK